MPPNYVSTTFETYDRRRIYGVVACRHWIGQVGTRQPESGER